MTLIQFYPVVRVANNGWKPNVDIFESDEDFVLSAEIPGMKKEDISLTLENNLLTLKGEKKKETATGDANYQLNERRFGRFCRSFVMPESIKPEKIRTSFKDGLLRVSIPKSEIVKEKEIKVEFP
jgi:HSP20 family protein